MSVDTKGILNKDITGKQIYDVVVDKIDKEAEFDIKMSNYKDYENSESGRIYFKDGEDKRSIFYCITEDQAEDTEYDKIKHVNLSLDKWGNSVQILTEIVKVFSGYVDESDCDDIGYFYIPKDGDFKYSEYIAERNEIESILDESLKDKEKIIIANQILKHREELKELL